MPVMEEIESACQIPSHIAKRYLRQYKVFCYIDQFIKGKGYSPSMREIAKSVGLSTSVVSLLIQRLSIEGYVQYTPDTARSLRIVKCPIQPYREVDG